MPVDLDPQGAALALALVLVFATGGLALVRLRHDPPRFACLLVGLIVLALGMAGSVTLWDAPEVGEMVETTAPP